MTEEEIQYIIDYEIVVDCYDDEEVNMSWFIYMSESIEFPFMAKVPIKKRGGTTEIHTVEVVSDATDEDRFGGEAFYVHVDYEGVLMKVEIRDVQPIDASENTLRALAIWRFDKGI
jgi:Calcium binding